jgi:hypothetical protein
MLFPKKHVRKALAPSLERKERKATTAIRKVRKCKTHTTMCEVKKRENKKSIQISWH